MDDAEVEMSFMYKTCISDGENLLRQLKEKKIYEIKGIDKLERKIKKDILFLTESLQRNNVKKEHIVCSNLHSYKALVEVIQTQPDCEAVMETMQHKDSYNFQKRLTVDVVSHKGQRWTKVIARNPEALHQIYKEGDRFGRRSIMDQAMSYVSAAHQNLHLYCSPQVVFLFVNGVPEEIKTYLEKLGITVEGKIFSECKNTISSSYMDSDNEEDLPFVCGVNTDVQYMEKSSTQLNLCISTMIAYISSLTNGGCNFTFKEPILTQQAEWERVRPVKPFLDNIFKGKELICCSTAMDNFKIIVQTIGGEEEKRRAFDLISIVKTVPDVDIAGLKPSGKMKKRSLVIFRTGHEHKAVTVTANKGFAEASRQKGLKFAVIIHESRALTELKQVNGV